MVHNILYSSELLTTKYAGYETKIEVYLVASKNFRDNIHFAERMLYVRRQVQNQSSGKW